MHRVLPGLLLALLAGGCARNAVLELELTLPAQPAGTPRYVVVSFETGDASFESDWRGAGTYPGTPLGVEGLGIAYSIETSTPAPLLVKVQFCETPDCSTEDSRHVPAVWYRLEQPFYIGQRTRWHAEIALVGGALPGPPASDADVIVVDKCQIQGCIDTSSTDTSFCRLSGEHFCE